MGATYRRALELSPLQEERQYLIAKSYEPLKETDTEAIKKS
jgi:hypothetical protein